MPIVVVVPGIHGERRFVARALHPGVADCRTGDRAPEELPRAIRCGLDGRRTLGEDVAGELADDLAVEGTWTEAPRWGRSSTSARGWPAAPRART